MARFIVGKVVRIISEYSVIIDKGIDDGVKEGMEGIIYQDLEPIRLDDGKEISYPFRKGKIVIGQAEPNFCIASTPVEYEILPGKREELKSLVDALALSSLYPPKKMVQRKLNVDPSDIQPLPKEGSKEIKVGDLVRIYLEK